VTERADLLEVRDVSISFGGVRALHDVSLTVTEGSIVGLIGPNGAGKTTLFNVVSGLLRADAGSIRFGGVEMAGMPPHRRAAIGVGRSFQNLGLMNDQTVATNVLALLHRSAPYRPSDVFLRPWRWAAGERELADRCHDVLSSFGLEGERTRPVGDLSFAKARFTELAAVVAEQPRLMLLDEPTTGLDIAETVRLAEILEGIRAGGATVLVVAHDVDFVMRVCDHVYVLAEGRLLFDGKPDEVRTHPAVIEAYLGRAA
jgi:ABC-type branched-subunit amino acid transport system ATPase component